MIKNLKDWKTTLLGLIPVLMMLLTTFNVVSAEEGTEISKALNTILNAIGGDVVGVIGVSLVSIGGVVQMFSKDYGLPAAKKKE